MVSKTSGVFFNVLGFSKFTNCSNQGMPSEMPCPSLNSQSHLWLRRPWRPYHTYFQSVGESCLTFFQHLGLFVKFVGNESRKKHGRKKMLKRWVVGCLGGCIGFFLGRFNQIWKIRRCANTFKTSCWGKSLSKITAPSKKPRGRREQLQYAMVPHGPYLFTWKSEV